MLQKIDDNEKMITQICVIERELIFQYIPYIFPCCWLGQQQLTFNLPVIFVSNNDTYKLASLSPTSHYHSLAVLLLLNYTLDFKCSLIDALSSSGVFFNCNSLRAKLNSHYETQSYKKKKYKRLKAKAKKKLRFKIKANLFTGNMFRKKQQLKCVC